MLPLVLSAITAAAVLLAIVLAFRGRAGQAEGQIQALRSEINILRQSSERSAQGMSTLVSNQLQGVQQSLQTALGSVTGEVAQRLDAITQQMGERLNDNATAMRSNSQEVNDRIASVQSTFAGLQKQVGEMTEQARQIGDLSRSISDLQNILSAPKLRGGVGEMQLENLLEMVFARAQFAIQYRFPGGEQVDAVLFFPQGLVAIDSKFPLSNFRRIAASTTGADKKTARKEFLKDVKRHIDDIATKYIRPDQGTLPFALMYVPAENVYYESVIRDEEGDGIHDYCLQRKVTPVSPNSLFAYLQTIAVGLKSMQINDRAASVLREIQSLQIDLQKFDDLYRKLGTHLKNAARNYDDSAREFSKLENRVESLTGKSREEQIPLLEEAKNQAAGSGDL